MKPIINDHFPGLKGKKFSGDIVASMLTGSFCQILTNPIWVIRVRMQADLLHKGIEERIYTSVPKSFSLILRGEGVQGFFKGTLASLMGNLLCL